jgi:predicted HicB family RNase H-like nuclease
MLRVRVPRHLWHRLLCAAHEEGITVSELARQAIDDRVCLTVQKRDNTDQD